MPPQPPSFKAAPPRLGQSCRSMHYFHDAAPMRRARLICALATMSFDERHVTSASAGAPPATMTGRRPSFELQRRCRRRSRRDTQLRKGSSATFQGPYRHNIGRFRRFLSYDFSRFSRRCCKVSLRASRRLLAISRQACYDFIRVRLINVYAQRAHDA